mgnify:CR=1 FL=1
MDQGTSIKGYAVHNAVEGHTREGCTFMQGGVGAIPEAMVEGLLKLGGRIEYKANARQILLEGSGKDAKAVGVRLSDGRVYR